MATDITIPRSVQGLRLELGKAFLLYAFKELQGMDMPDSLIRTLPESACIEAASGWCNLYHEGLRGLALIARRAEDQGDDTAHTSLMSDLMNDVGGCKTFLTECQPSYVADVFLAGTTQEGQALQDFLKLLQQFATLEN
jgi:hypothetical protein